MQQGSVRTNPQATAKPGTMGFSTPSNDRHTLPLTSSMLRLAEYCRGISYIRTRSSAPVRSTPEPARPVTPSAPSDPRPRSCPEPTERPVRRYLLRRPPSRSRKPNWLSAITTTLRPHHHPTTPVITTIITRNNGFRRPFLCPPQAGCGQAVRCCHRSPCCRLSHHLPQELAPPSSSYVIAYTCTRTLVQVQRMLHGSVYGLTL